MIVIKIETSAEDWTNRCISPLRIISPQDPKQRKISNNLHLAQLQKENQEQISAGSKFDSKFKLN